MYRWKYYAKVLLKGQIDGLQGGASTLPSLIWNYSYYVERRPLLSLGSDLHKGLARLATSVLLFRVSHCLVNANYIVRQVAMQLVARGAHRTAQYCTE